MKGVVVLRECRRTGCRHQCDAEDTAGHPTNNRKYHGTEYHWNASVAQSLEPTTPELLTLAICRQLAGDDSSIRTAACSIPRPRRSPALRPSPAARERSAPRANRISDVVREE